LTPHLTIGLNEYRDPSKLTWLNLLALPFVGKLGKYPTWMADEEEVTSRKK